MSTKDASVSSAGVHPAAPRALYATQDPLPGVVAHPFPSNLLEWHFVLEGGKGTEYEGGVYHGIMQFPPAYPYRPPSLQMLTPSGRFAVSQKICLSNTDYHAETWCARFAGPPLFNGPVCESPGHGS